MSKFPPFEISFMHFIDGTTSLVSHQDIPEFMKLVLKFIQEDGVYVSNKSFLIYTYDISYSDEIFSIILKMKDMMTSPEKNHILWHEYWQLYDDFWWARLEPSDVFYKSSRRDESNIMARSHFCRIIDCIEELTNE